MKRKESNEPDLYVDSRKLTAKDRKEISERIYEAAMGFEPIISETYYLYEKESGQDLLSLVAPEEWGRSFKYSRFLAKVTLLADHTWDVTYNDDLNDK